jgi:hypothetical protein
MEAFMRNALTLILATLALTLGVSAVATAGEVEKISLPLSGASYRCQVVNLSDRDIVISLGVHGEGLLGSGKKGTLLPGNLVSTGESVIALSAYCRVRYTGRPADIAGTLCTTDDLGNCTFAVPLE